ncbi:MAG TPA: tRNA (adenosine(37)-N6)-threonylcarbamoyltransferase complex ATPase subunit type 1 TsaE [Burkholderiales bacterium]|nr:tRNA (adenosine(37)-N6)-threonylcarbamoyltransferase complex ATPase subunit type 1 TsaE [Burkholderiales bacterium]
MPAALQPGEQSRLGVREVAVGDADLLEAELGPPAPDITHEISHIRLHVACYSTRLHTSHLKPPLHAHFLVDEAATLEFGAALARIVQPGMTIYLTGDLGAGKTTLARGLLKGLGYTGRVKSPTFMLVEVYKFSRLYLYHFDFYRFDEPNELGDAGFREYFSPDAICLIEWPEKAVGLPSPDIHVAIEITGDARTVELHADTEVGKLCLNRLQH